MITARTLSSQLVEVVRERILNGEALPDTIIRQDTLAKELGVSKIPLREALTRLEQEGLVRSRTNHGYYVCGMSLEEAEEVYALRLQLEPVMIAQAIQQAQTSDHLLARTAFTALAHEIEAHGKNIGTLNRVFHLALIAPCRQKITCTFLERLHILGERYVRKHLEPYGRHTRANIEHRKILNAWIKKNTKEAVKLTQQHIRTTLEDLRHQLKQR
jgi:DNA-binding GntR family transcriptional regulator